MVVHLQSSTAPALGRLSQVDVRAVWPSEANSFTPWLAQEENLRLLAETINMSLILEAREKPVGMFRADIIARNVHTGHLVLIENQLERTDHGHLGQLITYAAGLKAVSIVWVSSLFTDEHRAAFDWLNEVTDAGIAFYPRDAQRVCSQQSNWRERVLPCSHVCLRHREPFLTPNRDNR